MTTTPVTKSDRSAALISRLSQAAATLRTAQVRAARDAALDRGRLAVTAACMATAVTLLVCREARFGIAAAGVVAGVSVLACVGVVAGSWVIAGGRRRASTMEVAQRLDLAAQNRNAIATALDLSQNDEPSPWAQRAIADGLAAVESYKALPPVLPEAVPRRRQSLLGMGIGGLAILLAWWVPVAMIGGSSSHDANALASVIGIRPDDSAVAPPTPPTKRPDPAQLPAAAVGSNSSAPPDHVRQNTGRSDQSAAAANAASPGEPSASVGKGGGESSSEQPPQQKSQSNESQPAAQVPAQSDQKTLRTASFGSSSPDAAKAASTPSGGGGSKTGETKDGKDKGHSSEGQGAKQPDSRSDKSSEGGDGEGAGGKSEGAKGSGMSRSMTSGEGAGGDGQSSGQSPPKKSRGVAPLMLGSRQPDLLQGRELPGPDERTKLQVPPRPSPEDPAAPAAASSSQKAEPPVDNYRVPALDRRAVGLYFQQFHQDPDPASATAGDAR